MSEDEFESDGGPVDEAAAGRRFDDERNDRVGQEINARAKDRASVGTLLINARAAGVAEERARCLGIVRYEAWNHGAGDEPNDVAEQLSKALTKWIESGEPSRNPPT